jgi:hypothetical protein
MSRLSIAASKRSGSAIVKPDSTKRSDTARVQPATRCSGGSASVA